MKHAQPVASELLTRDDLVVALRARLDVVGRYQLARDLDITPQRLSQILRGNWPVSEGIAAGLGFRRVDRFERILS